MSKKEKVIIFEGEDKFVKPRHHSYDMNTGKAEFISGDGAGPSNDPSSNIPAPRNTPEGPNNQTTTSTIVGLPTLGEPDFCNKLQNFITTRGGGYATPDQIMGAHEMFKINCREADPTTTSTTTSTTTAAPVSTGTNVVAPNVPVVPVVPVIPFFPSTNLGVPPISGGGGGGGGDEEKPVEKKKSYWWLLLVALGIYLVAKKNKD